jgi:hypothetical protein
MISAQGAARVRGRSFDFLMIVDEADDFYRTQASLKDDNAKDDSAIKMDLAMRRLRDLRPLIRFEVSATLFAIYLSLVEMGKAARIPAGDIFYIESSSEYVGSDLLIPLEDANGKPIFLDQGELCVKNIFINDKVCKLWDDAMKEVPLPPDARALSWIFEQAPRIAVAAERWCCPRFAGAGCHHVGRTRPRQHLPEGGAPAAAPPECHRHRGLWRRDPLVDRAASQRSP